MKHRGELRWALPFVMIFVFLAPACVAPARAERPDQGYAARPCGFDLDDDGIIGEPIDDCRLCDGVTTDPDGDGVFEDLIYVDADAGSDTTGTGSPAQPFRTIQHAWDVADGPGVGAEDVICLRGTAAEQNLRPRVSGVAGVRVEPPTGSQARAFELPANPTMLVGWDSDGDGCYPPYDDGVSDVARCGAVADVAVLDGAGLDRAFNINDFSLNEIRYLEIAHLDVRDYGFQTASVEHIGFVAFGGGTLASHLYFHDLELDNVNRGKILDSRTINFSFFASPMHLQWVAVVNVRTSNTGSYFARGFLGTSATEGPLRFQNVSYTALGCSTAICGNTGFAATVTGFKLWGTLDGIEVLDSVFDTQAAIWNPRALGPNVAVDANACSRDWMVRNNTFRNWTTAFIVKGSDSSCGLRPTGDVVFDANTVVADAPLFTAGVSGLLMNDDGTATPEASISDVTAVNNVFYSEVGWRHCLISEAGNQQSPGPGTVVFAGNTCYGYPAVEAWGLIHLRVGLSQNGTPLIHPLPRFRIENNVLAGFRVGKPYKAMVFEYSPSLELIADHNVYDPMASYNWLGGVHTSLAGWQAATGREAGSAACTPLFVDPAGGDLHLLSTDICALDIGGDLSTYTAVDFDGDTRPDFAATDAGADELANQIFADGFESGNALAWPFSAP